MWSGECVAKKLKSGNDPNSVEGSRKLREVEPFDEEKDRNIVQGVHLPVLLIYSKVSSLVRENLKAFVNTKKEKESKGEPSLWHVLPSEKQAALDGFEGASTDLAGVAVGQTPKKIAGGKCIGGINKGSQSNFLGN